MLFGRIRMTMTDSKEFSLFRRRWLGLAATVSAASGLMGITSLIAQTGASSSGTGHDRGTRTYNIRDFGAKGDGVTLDTAAVQAALDACTNDQGGMVLVRSEERRVGKECRCRWGR